MDLGVTLSQPFAQHALIAGALIAIACGLLGPFVVTRGAAFAVHGSAELAFTGAAAGLLINGNAVEGALLGSVVVATTLGALGSRARERDTVIGVVLAFGLGLGVLLLGHYHGFASEATNILFGYILGVSHSQVVILLIVVVVVIAVTAVVWRPLLFASVDPDLAVARGVRVQLLGLLFFYLLAATVTEAAQIVGTLLVLSLTITPAAAASRLTARPGIVAALSIAIALIATDGGLLINLGWAQTTAPTVFVTFISFGFYLLARIASALGWIRR